MSVGNFVLVFVLAAVVLAFWTNVRLGASAPRDIKGAMLHLGISLIACQVVAPVATGWLVGTGSSLLRSVALMAITLPALVYALLSVIWVISVLQGQLRNGLLR